jgi:hypothetical protein
MGYCELSHSVLVSAISVDEIYLNRMAGVLVLVLSHKSGSRAGLWWPALAKSVELAINNNKKKHSDA